VKIVVVDTKDECYKKATRDKRIDEREEEEDRIE